MCHGFDGHNWSRESEESEESADDPSFLNEGSTDDVEVLTDGGDEE